jgi:hypothetical protein
MSRFTSIRRTALLAAAAVLAASCTGGSDGGSGGDAGGAGRAVSLRGVCPDPVVVQTDWFPGPEYGGIYQLVGDGGKVDKGIYRGPLGSTGVGIEIRPGGTAISFEPVNTLMYTDTSILLGVVDTTQAIESSRDLPTVGVVAPLDKSPLVLLWDPAQFSFTGLRDIGASKATVVYPEGAAYVDVLVGRRLLRRDQLLASYDGTSLQFTSEKGIVQQGTVGTDPYVLEHDLPEWRKPVKFSLVDDSGFRPYAALSARAETVGQEADCLAKLVPMIQRAQADYVRDPGRVNARLPEIAGQFAEYWKVSTASADEGLRTMRRLQVVGNGTNATVGDFDEARVAKVIADVVPTLADNEVQSVKPGVAPADLVTNRFIDPSVTLPG